MSKKYGFLMFFSIIFEVALLGLSAMPFLDFFRPVGIHINDSFISNLSKQVLFDSLGNSAFVLALIGIFVVGIYVMSYISSMSSAPVKSSIAFVVFALIAIIVIAIQVISFKAAPEPTFSKMEVTSTKIDSEFDIDKFMSLFFGSKYGKSKAVRNGVLTEVPKLCFDNNIDAEVSHEVYGLAKPGDEYYVVVINGEGYAYPVGEYSLE